MSDFLISATLAKPWSKRRNFFCRSWIAQHIQYQSPIPVTLTEMGHVAGNFAFTELSQTSPFAMKKP
jgi:hypothetical protein